ncbi:monocarboxylate transporter 6 [Chanos chanos]|uniref:Monocarboxylate transporter 6 n=1 Tax=Chanos chanos TaxID=29144 RepID=A0A6J2WJ51_CHACN|nr:monocarboxylate transporter 6-like [Chanos chanos]
MTEGVDFHQTQTQRTGESDGLRTIQRQSSRDTSHQAETRVRDSVVRSAETPPEQEESANCDSEQQEDQDGENSLPEGSGYPAGGKEDVHSQNAAPDGGWGWVVLVATILVLALTLPFPSCIGIFYTDLQTEFSASNTETSWVPAIMTAVLHAGGPLCSVLVERFGCRATVILGGILSGLGMVASSVAQTLVHLYIFAGVITGLGFCLAFQPSVTMMGYYFVRRRAFANALSSTGTALGLSTLPLLANFLLSRFGWRGSFLILGGALLNCCVCGAVMRPLGSSSKGRTGAKQSEIPLDKTNSLSIRREREGLKGRLRTTLSGLMAFLRRHLAFDLIRTHVRFCVFALGVTWMMLGFVVPLIYLVPYATAHGMTQDRAALLMSILGLVNISVRPVAALVFGLPRFQGSRRFIYVFAAALLVNGLSNCICGVAASFSILLVYVVIFGLSMSMIGSLLFTVLMDTVEMSRFPAALGLLSVMESIMLLLGPPLAGTLVDTTGQYKYVFYACSASVSSAGVFLMCSFYWLDSRRECENKIASSPGEVRSLKPVIKLAVDCEYTQVPLEAREALDSEAGAVSDV